MVFRTQSRPFLSQSDDIWELKHCIRQNNMTTLFLRLSQITELMKLFGSNFFIFRHLFLLAHSCMFRRSKEGTRRAQVAHTFDDTWSDESSAPGGYALPVLRWKNALRPLQQIWSLRASLAGTNVLILFLLASVENGRLIFWVACLNFDSVLTDMKVSELGFGNWGYSAKKEGLILSTQKLGFENWQ